MMAVAHQLHLNLSTPQTKVGHHVHLDGLCHWEIDMVEAVNAWKHLGTKNNLFV